MKPSSKKDGSDSKAPKEIQGEKLKD